MSKLPPVQCLLCNARSRIIAAKVHQLYAQQGSTPAILDWWECRACKGWFAYPVPTPEVIERHWQAVGYNDPRLELEIARGKEALQRRVLAGLSHWTKPGPLLDFGCNFGNFLLLAKEAGWTPCGFEVYAAAAEAARMKGCDVRCGWSFEEAGFPQGYFTALTAIDVFGLVWHPFRTLEAFHRVLKPGGVLAMRLTNKRFVLGLARAFSASGPTRDIRISRILKAQFHTIGLTPLRRIMRGIGFDRIRVEPRAVTAPWSALGWQTLIAYLGADIIGILSLMKINLSPGVLLLARKAMA